MVQFLMNCTNLTLSQMKHKNFTISISAMVCFVVTILILILLVFYKAYKSRLQRLFQYLTLVTALHLGFISMDIQLQFDLNGGPELCKWLGFLRQWTATMTYFFVLGITFYLLYFVYYKLKGDPLLKLIGSKSNRIIMEVCFVAIVILSPLLFLWIPFYHGTYGVYETSCWIQKIHNNCSKSEVGSIDQIAFVTILRLVMIIVLISFIVLAVAFCRFAYHYRLTRSQHFKTIRQIFTLMGFFVISALIEITGLILYSYTAITNKSVNSYTFWVVYDVAMPLSQLIIPIGFMVYLYSLKKFRWNAIKSAASEWKFCFICCANKNQSCCSWCWVKKQNKFKTFKTAEGKEPGIKPNQKLNDNIPSQTESLPVPYTGIASVTQPLISVARSTYAINNIEGKETKGHEVRAACKQPESSYVYSETVSLSVPYTGEFTSVTQPLLSENVSTYGIATENKHTERKAKGIDKQHDKDTKTDNSHLNVSFASETASVSFAYTGEFTSAS